MVNELNLDPKTEVKIKNIDVEVIKGDLSQKPWLIDSEEKKYILFEEEQYNNLLSIMEKMLEENLELKMEKMIMAELPLDLEDVKEVVKREIFTKNITLEKAIQNVKKEHPNLFHKLEIDQFIEEIFLN